MSSVIAQGVEQRNARFKAGLVGLAVDVELHRDLAGSVHGHLLARRHHHLRSGHDGHSGRDSGNLQEVAPGNAGTFFEGFFRFFGTDSSSCIPVLHAAGRVRPAVAGLRRPFKWGGWGNETSHNYEVERGNL